eukprot:6195779-Pleurochrysis_carterae.AAC.9
MLNNSLHARALLKPAEAGSVRLLARLLKRRLSPPLDEGVSAHRGFKLQHELRQNDCADAATRASTRARGGAVAMISPEVLGVQTGSERDERFTPVTE